MRGTRFTRRTAGASAAALALTAVSLIVLSPIAAPVAPRSSPESPSSVTAGAGNRSLHVSWTESTTGVISFLATAKAPGHLSVTCLAHGDACTVLPLSNGVVYDVTVVAKSVLGTSAPSSDVTALVGVPGPPQSVRATSGKAKVAVSWAAPKPSSVAKVTGYTATAAPGGFSCSTASTLLTKAGHSCQIAGLTSGAAYTVTVSATNAYGTGTPSKAASVTPS
ncbi:MAG TPA: fibronectin type III domain-containing protein [Acidimicrobiales bacterium]|nr:fibronectin type III domain-containing protein [Acidimicrobiales bacterium]